MLFSALITSVWMFKSAPLAVAPATGREIAPDVHEMRVPSRGSCGWWETSAPVAPGGGVRFRAAAEKVKVREG